MANSFWFLENPNSTGKEETAKYPSPTLELGTGWGGEGGVHTMYNIFSAEIRRHRPTDGGHLHLNELPQWSHFEKHPTFASWLPIGATFLGFSSSLSSLGQWPLQEKWSSHHDSACLLSCFCCGHRNACIHIYYEYKGCIYSYGILTTSSSYRCQLWSCKPTCRPGKYFFRSTDGRAISLAAASFRTTFFPLSCHELDVSWGQIHPHAFLAAGLHRHQYQHFRCRPERSQSHLLLCRRWCPRRLKVFTS